MPSSHSPTALARLKSSLLTRGAGRTAILIAEQYIFRRTRAFVFYRVMESDRPQNPAFTYKMVRPEEVGLLSVFSGYYKTAVFSGILEEGDFLFIALDGTTPVSFIWFSRKPRRRPPYSFFRIQNSQVWCVDFITLPTHSNEFVTESLLHYSDKFLMNLGFNEMLAVASEEDLPRLRFLTRSHPRSVQYFVFTRIFWFILFRRELNARQRCTLLIRTLLHPV